MLESIGAERSREYDVVCDIELMCVRENASMWDVLRAQQSAADAGLPAGIALVVDKAGSLKGVITDGDIRRALLRDQSMHVTAGTAMERDPILFLDGTSFGDVARRLPIELRRRGRRSRRFLGKIVLVDHEGRPTRVLDYHQLWEQRVATHRHVAVVGMGYVGLTLALILSNAGFTVTGVESDPVRANQLRDGHSYVHESGIEALLQEALRSNFTIADEVPSDSDVFIIAVGTPVDRCGPEDVPQADLGSLRAAVEAVGHRLMPGGLVVLRSTVPVGTTRGVVKPILEQRSGLRGGIGFHLAVAPERTLEGKALEELCTLPQIVGGLDDDSVNAAAALFRETTSAIVRLDSLEAAELAKLINNSFRDLTFAFANELAITFAPHGLDIAAVIQAANRGYPRGLVPLPSPGVGGPCLTKDPYLLATGLAAAGRAVNESMPDFVVASVVDQLRSVGKIVANCSVLVCGMAFKGKPETTDMRQSTSLHIVRKLAEHVGSIYVHDPVVPASQLIEQGLMPVDLSTAFTDRDAALFLTNHPLYGTISIAEAIRAMREPAVLFDGWGLFRQDDILNAAPSVCLGLGFVRSSLKSCTSLV
jgi:nucleotide sugar dehydrogenase